MKVQIYRPARSAMQSGPSRGEWVVEFPSGARPPIDALTGWTGSLDTKEQLRLGFATKDEAVSYAKRTGLDFSLSDPALREIKPKSYAANFAFRRAE